MKSSYFVMLIGGTLGFGLGVIGNLVAGWIQQDVLGNIFSPKGIGIMLGLAVAGISLAALYDHYYGDSATNKTSVKITGGRATKSKIVAVDEQASTANAEAQVEINLKDIEDSNITGVKRK